MYKSDCWGNAMKGIEATEPCVYLIDESIEARSSGKSKVFRVI